MSGLFVFQLVDTAMPDQSSAYPQCPISRWQKSGGGMRSQETFSETLKILVFTVDSNGVNHNDITRPSSRHGVT